ncbi:endolytic transglycosylase MltG [Candidatus Daviesbacteria bacterium]|nr:endolytic transglycosylase MltG [Candidatus Daviesbacteria bacterium]
MKKLITILIFITIIIFIAKGWWESQLAPVSSDKSTKIVVVEKGQSFTKLSQDLEKEKLIKSSWAFNLYAKQTNMSTKIQTGTFRLSPSMSADQILKVLSSQPLDNWVTLLEGWRIEEMASVLSSKFKIQSSKFIKLAAEGYMFPDTYLFPQDVTEEQIVKKLGDNFDTKFSDDLKAKIKALSLTEKEGVILASIVEREARSDKVRTMVASILLRRFKIRMGLNADATVQYALGYQPQEKSWWKRRLTFDDLKVSSPYNTYIHAGLPPAPIANPSLSSLQAVADADPSTPYLYYFHDSRGNSYYAKSLEEHNQNVARYR